MFRSIIRLAFGPDERGVVAVLFAVLSVPLLTVMAVGVDLSQYLVMRQQLQSAVDAAALNAGQASTVTDEVMSAQVNSFINANYPSLSRIGTLQSVAVTRTAGLVSITANASMKTNFLQIIGYKTLDFTVRSTIAVNQNKMEVALVLDNTGSMTTKYGSTTGIAGLRDAATTLVNTLYASDPERKYVKVAVVPFTQAVNVGTQYAGASWIDTKGAGTMTKENINVPAGQGLISFVSQLKNASWGGCVRQRTEPYDVQEVAPTPLYPDTLYTPYVAPSEPPDYSSYQFCNRYLSGTEKSATGQASTTYYANGTVQALGNCANSSSPASFKGLGPNFGCALQPIIRLTNDTAAILDEIDDMKADGGTVIPAGLMWGWHVISPNGPFGDGIAYTDTTTIKAIILVTDGQNDVQLNGSTSSTNGFNKSIYSAYGYAANANGSGATHLSFYSMPSSYNGVQAATNYNLDQKMIQLCNNIKAVTDSKGNPGRILIYAIGFGSSINSNSLKLLQQCATSSETYFYNPTSDELNATFQAIAIGLNKLRISR